MAMNTFGRRAAMVVGGGGVYVAVTSLTYFYLSSVAEKQKEEHGRNCNCCGCGIPAMAVKSFVDNYDYRANRYNVIASDYDQSIGMDETFMGMILLRRALLYFNAKGTVLEVAAGTGRNSTYYPTKNVERVVLSDSSKEMLEEAQKKIQEKAKNKTKFATLQVDGARLCEKFPDNSFDTVVDTFGLCSFDDPVLVLKQMQRVCKPNGKILLLEHGRSKSWNWINSILDKGAERHAKNWGCVWNRDLDKIFRQAGVVLEAKYTWHFGTTYYVVSRPSNSVKQAS